MPQIIILAGPNGAGKSTFAARFVPEGVPFVNADNIAKELNALPGQNVDLAAGRILIRQLAELERGLTSFALETNLANRTLAGRIPRWRAAGYDITLYFVWLPSDEMAVRRVAQRVRSGGHDIPEATIRRRYQTGLRMFFEIYQPLVNRWFLYDNSGDSGPLLIAQSVRLPSGAGNGTRVKNRPLWEIVQAQHQRGNDKDEI